MMNTFKTCIASILLVALSLTSAVSSNNAHIAIAFTTAFEEIEAYRNWTVGRFGELELVDGRGRVSPERVSELTDQYRAHVENMRQAALMINKSCAKILTIPLAYAGEVSDSLGDYMISESLAQSLNIIFIAAMQGQETAEILKEWRRKAFCVISQAACSIQQQTQLEMYASNPALGDINEGITAVQNDAHALVDYFATLGPDQRHALSHSRESEGNLFCATILSRAIKALDPICEGGDLSKYNMPAFGTREYFARLMQPPEKTFATTVKEFARTVEPFDSLLRDYENQEKSETRSPALQQKLIARQQAALAAYMNEAKFRLADFEKPVAEAVYDHLQSEYGAEFDVTAYKPSSLKPKPTKKGKGKSKKPNKKAKGKKGKKAKGKQRASKAPSQPKKTTTKATVAAEPELIDAPLENEDKLPHEVASVPEAASADEDKLSHEVASAPEALSADEDDLATTAVLSSQPSTDSDSNDDAELFDDEYDHEAWYQENVLNRIVAVSPETQGPKAQKEEVTYPEIHLKSDARAFYDAVTSNGTNVKTKHFLDFLRCVGGSLDRSSGSGSAVDYYLPNFSSSRARNPFLKFVVHLPHGGNGTFPRKTLAYFVKRAFDTCQLETVIPE